MTDRELRPEDIPELEEIAAKSEFPYPDLRNVEAGRVVVDADGKIVMAAAAKRLVEMYLYVGESTPAVKMQALSLIHNSLTRELKEKGYHSVEAFLPPQVEKRFARRLERTFRWVRNWPSWTKDL
jgi:hypothetical protein